MIRLASEAANGARRACTKRLSKAAFSLLCFLSPFAARAAALDVYADLTGKSLLTSMFLPRVPDSVIADLPADRTNAIAKIESELVRNGFAIIQDGPHFVRLFQKDQAVMSTNAPLRGADLAALPGQRTLPKGALNFMGFDFEQAFPFYESLSHRTLLRPANLPRPPVTFQSRCPLTEAETAYALETVFIFNGIAIVDDGMKFAQVVPLGQRPSVIARSPKPEPDAKLLDPDEVPALGQPEPVRPMTKVERDLKRWQAALYQFVHYKKEPDRSAQRLLELYASLTDKSAESSKEFDGVPIWFHIQTPMSRTELLYAIETTFVLNGFAIIPVDDKHVRLSRRGVSSAANTQRK